MRNMITDTHQHVSWHRRDDAALVADLDEQSIDLAWLLTWVNPPAEDASDYRSALNPVHLRPDGSHPGLPLADVLSACLRYPDRFIPGYCPDPLVGDAATWFENAVKMHGVRICGEWKFRMLLDDPRCIVLFRKAGELGCPVVLHFDAPWLIDRETGTRRYAPAWYGGTMENLERTLKACPETTFIGHGPGFWREISGDADESPDVYPVGPVTAGGRLIRLLESHANLWADLSAGSALRALGRDVEFATSLLVGFADRLLFGRDYYGSQLLEFLHGLELPAEVRENLFWRNAARLIPAPGAS